MDTLLSMKVFCQVVQSGSFTRAAELLDISIPMASKHVAHLEKTIRVQLLYRNKRHLKLTEQGEHYYRECLHALDMLDQAAIQAASGIREPEGTLRISVPVWFANDQFAQWLAEYRLRYPQVELMLTLTNRSIDLNSDGEDIALRMSQSMSPNVIAKHLCDIPFYLLAAPDYLARHGTPHHAQDLRQHHGVLPVYTDLSRKSVEYQGETQWLELNAAVRSNNTQMIAAMVRAGTGIGYLPAWLAEEDLRAGRLVRLLPEHRIPEVPLYAVYMNRRFINAKVRSFIDFMIEKTAAAKN